MKTKKVKVVELTGAALDWTVANIEVKRRLDIGLIGVISDGKWQEHDKYGYSTDWALAGPIIEREAINLTTNHGSCGMWGAYYDLPSSDTHFPPSGTTPLIAAMRCYVAHEMGEEVKVPVGLLPSNV